MKPGDLRARVETTRQHVIVLAVIIRDMGQDISVVMQAVNAPKHDNDGLSAAVAAIPRHLFCKEKHAVCSADETR